MALRSAQAFDVYSWDVSCFTSSAWISHLLYLVHNIHNWNKTHFKVRKTPVWNNTACLSSRVPFALSDGLSSLSLACLNWLVSLSLNCSSLSASLFFELLLPLAVYLCIYFSFYPLTHSFTLQLYPRHFSIYLSFFLPLSRCYPPVSPDAAKLIRTHPINSGPVYAGTS